MERFKEAIYKKREEINETITDMFILLKEYTNGKPLEKVLVRKEEVVEQSKVLEDKEIKEEVDDDELDRSGDDNPTRCGKYSDRLIEMPRSQPIGTPSGILLRYDFGGVTEWYQSTGYRELAPQVVFCCVVILGDVIAREQPMTIEEARLQLQETKRLADLKATKEKSRENLRRLAPEQLKAQDKIPSLLLKSPVYHEPSVAIVVSVNVVDRSIGTDNPRLPFWNFWSLVDHVAHLTFESRNWSPNPDTELNLQEKLKNFNNFYKLKKVQLVFSEDASASVLQVETRNAIPLSGEEIILDEAASEARSSEAEEEDLTLEEALN
nr:hypothetical protein [Tanacetum cinerariifolium]